MMKMDRGDRGDKILCVEVVQHFLLLQLALQGNNKCAYMRLKTQRCRQVLIITFLALMA